MQAREFCIGIFSFEMKEESRKRKIPAIRSPKEESQHRYKIRVHQSIVLLLTPEQCGHGALVDAPHAALAVERLDHVHGSGVLGRAGGGSLDLQ